MYQNRGLNSVGSAEQAVSNPVQQLNDGKAPLLYA